MPLALLASPSWGATTELAPPLLSHECQQSAPAHFPAPGQAPEARVFRSEADGLPAKAVCIAHGPPGSTLWVSVAGTMSNAATAEAVLARFGALSQMRQIKYWSISDQMWRPLFASAAALTGPGGKERDDLSLEELKRASPLYFEQADSRTSRKVVYELRVLRADRDGFVVSTVNVSPLQWWGITAYKPGDLDTRYFFERAAAGAWQFYSLARMPPGGRLFNAQDGSYINRAVAMYRFLLGVPTDAEPPAAP